MLRPPIHPTTSAFQFQNEARADNSIKATFEWHGLNVNNSTDAHTRMPQSAKGRKPKLPKLHIPT